MKRLPLIVILLSLFPPTLQSLQQPTSHFAVGSRVRLESCAPSSMASGLRIRRRSGQLVHADSTTLVLQLGTSRLDSIPVNALTAGWESMGRRSRWTTGLRGLLLGAAAGSLLGFGLDLVNDNRTGDGSGEAFESILLPLFGGVFGGGLGAVVGIASGGEQWKRVPLATHPAYGCAPAR